MNPWASRTTKREIVTKNPKKNHERVFSFARRLRATLLSTETVYEKPYEFLVSGEILVEKPVVVEWTGN